MVDNFLYVVVGLFIGYASRPFVDIMALVFSNAYREYLKDRQHDKT